MDQTRVLMSSNRTWTIHHRLRPVRLRPSILAIILLGTLLTAPAATRAAERQLIWPLEGRIAFTSTFGEYRTGRYHAGVDFSTGGRNGLPLQAVDDGYVWRVSTSAYGYGKVVHVRLDDGRTAVYAHLSRFNAATEELVRQEQERRQSYTIDFYLQPEQVSVKRGDIVAWSGDTGLGVPHLHFELRDDQNRALSPLQNGLEFHDTVPPRFGALAFIPLDGDARINGEIDPVIVPLTARGGTWVAGGVPELSGRIGVAVTAWDRTQNSRYVLGLHTTTMAVDGDQVFFRAYDRLLFQTMYLSALDRNFFLLSMGRGRYLNLFIEPGNTLEIYHDLPVGSGILACAVPGVEPGERRLSPGRHTLAIDVGDFGDDRARARVDVIVTAAPEVVDFLPEEPAGNSQRLRIAPRDTSGDVTLTAAVSADGGRSWRSPEQHWVRTSGRRGYLEVSLPEGANGALVRATARDGRGVETTRTIRLASLREPPAVSLQPTWGRYWCTFEIRTSHPLRNLPRISATWPADVDIPLRIVEIRPGVYEGSVTPQPSWPATYGVRLRNGPGLPRLATHWPSQDAAVGWTEALSEDGPRGALYRGVITFGETLSDSALVRVDADGAQATFVVHGHVFGPHGGEYSSPDGDVTLTMGDGVAAEPILVRMEKRPPQYHSELEPVGYEYTFEPQQYPLAGEATVEMEVAQGIDLTGLALCDVSSRGPACLAVPDPRSGRTIRASVRSLPTVALYRDRTPPTIRISRPAAGVALRTRTPQIVAVVYDGGVGFDRSEDSMEMRIDDVWVPAAYESWSLRYRYTPTTRLAPGPHTVVIRAHDRVGNERTATLRFTVE